MFRAFSGICLFFSLLMVLVALVDFSMEGHEYFSFMISSGFVALPGCFVYFLGNEKIDKKRIFVMVGGSWFLVSFISSLPFALMQSKISYIDSLFESVSGITTTGATVLNNLDDLSPGILLWRSVLQAIGGLGIILGMLAIFPAVKELNIHKLVLVESTALMNDGSFTQRRAAILVVGVYIFLMFLCALLYFFSGMSVFDSFCHALTTVSTGGFANYDNSFAQYDDWKIMSICIIFMLVGSVPFLVILKMIFSAQMRYFAIWALSFLLIVSITLYLGDVQLDPIKGGTDTEMGFLHVIFTVVSIFTTTGFVVIDYSNWNRLFALLIAAMMVGGCMGSTNGGIKVFRVVLLFRSLRVHLVNWLQPNRVFSSLTGDASLPKVEFAIHFFLYVIWFCISSIAFAILSDLDFISTVSAAAASISNFGPGLGDSLGPSSDYSSVNALGKVVLIMNMIAGRLEILGLLLFFGALLKLR